MKKTILFAAPIAAALAFSACGAEGKKTGGDSTATQSAAPVSASVKDEKLSGFMLGGIYFINGYGGVDAVNKMINSTDKAAIVDSYKQILEFPFKPDDAAGAQDMLREGWDIRDKESLVKTLDKLTQGDPKNTHRAWDYARLVNNACMGYAAGYITRGEAEKYIAAALPLARRDFKTWDDYFADWLEGRKTWGGDQENNKTYEDLAKTITRGENSIYQIQPLN
ncbi:DUF1266 domain-containing protein [Chitinophaga polysaccharea]|uniref:DUF1266 domain-containing protein n=1 Tax=Chitinophaga TaxID=79328 RepID=UPI0014554D42|nr:MULTISPECIES: DUF1266 domain-containing protein [Chitinophaga]NLR60424.1 DUF1266 domain-containing protein [Chitinophaga polysaccharea]NLU90340.1 DUF1266 domain-containing protein [Chitinophaga sp. Ak27]